MTVLLEYFNCSCPMGEGEYAPPPTVDVDLPLYSLKKIATKFDKTSLHTSNFLIVQQADDLNCNLTTQQQLMT